MKLLIVITGLGMGGAEHVAVNLADGLIERNFQVKIVYLTGQPLVLPKSPKIEVQSLGMTNKLDALKAYKKLIAIIKEYSPDIVHSHMFHANLLARLARLKSKFPHLICTAHSTNEGGHLTMMAYRLTDRLATISTNVSQEAVDVFIKKKAAPLGRMIAIPNGIDTKKFKYIPNYRKLLEQKIDIKNSFCFLAVGRLTDAKDYPNLLRAFSIVIRKSKDNARLIIVGEGPIKNDLLVMANELNISQNVFFMGIRRDIPELMSATDAFVLSSKHEGLPLVVGEAMACERCVVATDCGGVKEVVGDAGVLVKPQSPEALASGMLKILSMPRNERIELGKKARERIEREYSLRSNIDNYINTYTAYSKTI